VDYARSGYNGPFIRAAQRLITDATVALPPDEDPEIYQPGCTAHHHEYRPDFLAVFLNPIPGRPNLHYTVIRKRVWAKID
jgi:hypothetical protein